MVKRCTHPREGWRRPPTPAPWMCGPAPLGTSRCPRRRPWAPRSASSPPASVGTRAPRALAGRPVGVPVRRCSAGDSPSPAPGPRRSGSGRRFRCITTDSTTTIVPWPLCVALPPSWINRTPVSGPPRASSTGTPRTRADGSIERLVEQAQLALRLLVAPQLKFQSLTRSCPERLRVNWGPMSRAQMSTCSSWKKRTWSSGTPASVRALAMRPRRPRPAPRGSPGRGRSWRGSSRSSAQWRGSRPCSRTGHVIHMASWLSYSPGNRQLRAPLSSASLSTTAPSWARVNPTEPVFG